MDSSTSKSSGWVWGNVCCPTSASIAPREKNYHWTSPQDDLAAAEKFIHIRGYHRRDQELADAKLAILGK